MNEKDNMAILDDLQKSIEGIPYDNVVMSGSNTTVQRRRSDGEI